MRKIVTLICTECKERNYTTSRNKDTSPLNLRKYCKRCRKHTLHKEK
ncbi:50S ribosomal protein L33 [Candidatus Aerophobetes bacterium]|uniref:Large ribosomal subunit protein bL33 n=1 Tax=Aerophobetes bacterium TaxID=2030807 RepID=A0A523V0Z7_UNCAE|nr:MAG: 50S ribosomal protein L33 [Candidatus Aerophobetes bacterium]TET48383.1 MAG: 50S ribosomal protein L33 [Candidatus Aerophobetes bacterium]